MLTKIMLINPPLYIIRKAFVKAVVNSTFKNVNNKHIVINNLQSGAPCLPAGRYPVMLRVQYVVSPESDCKDMNISQIPSYGIQMKE